MLLGERFFNVFHGFPLAFARVCLGFEAVFPKLCASITSDIDFEQCQWRCSRSHRKTARYVPLAKALGGET